MVEKALVIANFCEKGRSRVLRLTQKNWVEGRDLWVETVRNSRKTGFLRNAVSGDIDRGKGHTDI